MTSSFAQMFNSKHHCLFNRGFGAKLGGVTNHCFQCGSKEEVDGVDGILQAYRDTFRSGLVMSGPTDISEIILKAGDRANSRQVNTASAYIRLLNRSYNYNALDLICRKPLVNRETRHIVFF